jgi:SNF family Na+-dependent transporter
MDSELQPLGEPLTAIEETPEAPKRDNWDNDIEYILVWLGFAVGYGALWLLPYYFIVNGGILFLVPYICAMLFLIVPMITLENSLGQYTGASVLNQFRMVSKKWKGITVLQITTVATFSLNYIIIMAWGVVYFFKSFQHPLPWNNDANFDAEYLKNPKNREREYFYKVVLQSSENQEFGTFVPEILCALVGSWFLIYIC